MLTAVDGVSDDILYSTSADGGTVASRYQDWDWPAQPAVSQQARMRELFSQTTRGRMAPSEDFAFWYINRGPGPYQPPKKVPGQVTMVCYAASSACGFGRVGVRPGTWSQFPLPPDSSEVSTAVGAGSPFSPAAIAQGSPTGSGGSRSGPSSMGGRPLSCARRQARCGRSRMCSGLMRRPTCHCGGLREAGSSQPRGPMSTCRPHRRTWRYSRCRFLRVTPGPVPRTADRHRATAAGPIGGGPPVLSVGGPRVVLHDGTAVAGDYG